MTPTLSRRALFAAMTAAGALAFAAPALAQGAFPSKPIRLVVPYLPGGVTDVMARQFAQVMTEQLGQPVVVDNKPGGNTLIATQNVATSPADGYSLLFTDMSLLSYNAHLYKQPPYDLARDFVPVSSVAEIPLGLAVNTQVPAANLAELIAYAKANPRKLNYATTASGGLPHLAMENLKATTGTDMVHVPYKGAAAAITDIIGGQVQVMFNDVSTAIQYVSAGKLKVLALSGEKRSPKLPDVPTFAELGKPELGVSVLMGILAPAKTPPAVVERLNAAVRAAAGSAQVTDYLQTNNLTPRTIAGDALKTSIAAEEKKWRALVTKLNLSVD